MMLEVILTVFIATAFFMALCGGKTKATSAPKRSPSLRQPSVQGGPNQIAVAVADTKNAPASVPDGKEPKPVGKKADEKEGEVGGKGEEGGGGGGGGEKAKSGDNQKARNSKKTDKTGVTKGASTSKVATNGMEKTQDKTKNGEEEANVWTPSKTLNWNDLKALGWKGVMVDAVVNEDDLDTTIVNRRAMINYVAESKGKMILNPREVTYEGNLDETNLNCTQAQKDARLDAVEKEYELLFPTANKTVPDKIPAANKMMAKIKKVNESNEKKKDVKWEESAKTLVGKPENKEEPKETKETKEPKEPKEPKERHVTVKKELCKLFETKEGDTEELGEEAKEGDDGAQ